MNHIKFKDLVSIYGGRTTDMVQARYNGNVYRRTISEWAKMGDIPLTRREVILINVTGGELHAVLV